MLIFFVPELDEERDQIRERQRLIGKLLTDPDSPGLQRPFTSKKYYLRGIAGKSDVMYVCRRTRKPAQTLVEVEDDAGPADQWWALGYTAGSPDPVMAVV
jgi:hypothetical protein